MNGNVVPLHFNPESLAYLDNDHAIVDYVEGELVTGKKIWAYLNFTPSSYMRYVQKKLRGDNIFLLEFGELLVGGHGEGPTNDDIKEMEEKVSANPKFSDELKQEIDRFVYGAVCIESDAAE